MRKLIFAIISVSLLSLIASKSTTVFIEERLKSSELVERYHFFNDFNGHRSLRSYLKSSSKTVQIMAKYSERLKMIWREYVNENRHIERVTQASNSEEDLQNHGNHYFYGQISIGTPPQNFSVGFDTSMSLTQVPDPACNDCGDNSTAFFGNTSSSYQFIKHIVEPGDSEYNLVSESVTIGGLTAQNLKIGLNVKGGAYFYRPGPRQGIVALQWSPDPSYSFVESLYKQKLISQAMFSLYLNSPNSPSGSRIVFGAPDSTLYTGNLNYYNNTVQENYQIAFQGLNISGTVYSDGGDAYFDTSAFGIVVSKDFYKQFKKLLKDINNLPTVLAVFGSDSYQFNITYTDDNGNKALSLYAGGGSGATGTFFGIAFLKQYYTVYDVLTNRVGLATPVNSS